MGLDHSVLLLLLYFCSMVIDDPVQFSITFTLMQHSFFFQPFGRSFADQFTMCMYIVYACVRPECVYVIIFYMLCFIERSLAGSSLAADLPMFEHILVAFCCCFFFLSFILSLFVSFVHSPFFLMCVWHIFVVFT